MATEADAPEGPEPISVVRIKEEPEVLDCSHLDKMVSKASSIGELQKVGNGHCSLTSETVEKSINTEDSDVVSQNFNNNINNHILEGKVGSTEGETFLNSTTVANGASDESIQGSEICDDRENLDLVQKEDVSTNRGVEETHDIIATNNIVALDKHDTSMTLENAKFEDEEEIAHSSKLPSEVNITEISTAESYLSIPNITSASLDLSVQEEKIEGREREAIVEEEKQACEESSDDRRPLMEETDKEEIWQHQHVESSTAESYEQTSEVTTVSQKDESESKTEDPSFELREQVGQTVEATPDHNESVKKMEVSKDESMGLVTLTNGENKEKNCDSENIPIKQDVVYDDVTPTKEQEEAVLLKAEPEEKEKLECASSQAMKDIKEADKPCQEEVPIGHETAVANEYTDKQIIREDVATKYQSSAVSFGEEMVQSSQTNEEVEMKQDAEVPVGIEVDRVTKNSVEKVIAEKEAVEDHCEASTGAETVQKANDEEEKEVNKPEEEDSTGTQTTIVVEDIQEDTFENNNAVNDHCIESDWEKPINKNSQEDLEVSEELKSDEAKKDIAQQITEENKAVEDYCEASTGEETIQKANQEDENQATESIKEDCSGTQTIIAYEDTQEHALGNNNAANGHCTESEGGKTVNVEENPGEDLEGNMPGVEVFEGLETNAITTASENTSKHILKDDVVTSLLPVSIGDETTKAIHMKDEAHEKIENRTTSAEQNVQDDIIATDLPAISLLEKIIRNSCQEDEACSKEPETRGCNDDAVKEYVEANGAITDTSAMVIGEGTTVEDSHEEEKKTIPEGKDECDSNSEGLNFKTMNCASDRDLVNLDNEEEPNTNSIGYVNTKVFGEEIQRGWNEKLVDSLATEVCDEHIEKEITLKNERTDDKLETNVSVNQNMSFDEAEPEGVKLNDPSDLPSVETSPLPIEANETSLEAPHVEELKLDKNSGLDEKAGKEILEKEKADENRARDEIKYYMTHGASNVLVPEYKDHEAEPISETEADTKIQPTIESEILLETSILSSGKLDPESTEANMTIKDDTPTEDQIQDEVQETSIERTKNENFMQKEDSFEETTDVQEKKQETIQPEETISNELTVEDEIFKPRYEEVLQQSLEKDESEVDKQETCVDLMSKGLDTVDSSANDEKDTCDKVERGEENLKENVKGDIQNGELSGISHTRNQTALQEEEGNLVDLASTQQNQRTADSCEIVQNGETDTLRKDEDDTSVSDLKPKEDDDKEAHRIGATEEIKSTENGTLYHEKADGLVESVERECGKLEPIDSAEKLRDASETTAEDQSVITSIETEQKGQIVMDQHTGSVEICIIVQNTQEEDMEAEKFGEGKPSFKPEVTDPEVHSDADKVIQEGQRADKNEEIEKQITEKDAAAKLYAVSTSDEAIKKVQDTDITGNEQNIEGEESNEKKEVATVQDEDSSKPDVASMVEELEEEEPKKVVSDELSETFTSISEVLRKNNQETAEDLPGMAETESAFVATEERSSQAVESECEKIVLPTGICSEERTLEPVETIEPIMKDEVESANLEEKSELMSEPPPTLISEIREENCKEPTEGTSLQKVEPEGEKSVLPSGIGSEEKSLEIVETETILVDGDINSMKFEEKSELISQFSSIRDRNGTQEKSIEEKLDGNKLEEEIKDVFPASDALSGSEDQREEATSQFENAAEKTEENLQEYSALMSETQELGTLTDSPTIIDASDVKHNPDVESTVCENVEADKEDAQKIQVTAADEVLKDEDQMEDETQDKNVHTPTATEIIDWTHPPKEEECKELKVSPMEFEDVNETPNVESIKEIETRDISPAFALGENVSELKTGSVLDSEEPTELIEPIESCEQNLKDGRTSESGAWTKELENNELEECSSGVEEETETFGASEDPNKDVTVTNVQVKDHEENSSEDCKEDTTMCADPNEEHSEILVNLGEKIGSLKGKNTIHNEDDSAKMNSSVEEKLVGEVGGECNEASNPKSKIPQNTLEFVSEAQTHDALLKRTENDEDGKDMGEISLVQTMGKEHLKEENQIKEREENEYLNKEIAQEVCAKLENSDTSKSNEKKIQGEEGCVEEPCPISVGKDIVTESRQEAHTGEPFVETHMKLDPAESGNEQIADQIAKTNEATEVIKNETLIEEIQGFENGNANSEMLITKDKEVSKIILEETNKETIVSTETRDIFPAKNEEGPDMNLNEKPTTCASSEAEPTENMNGMVVEPSSLELEEATTTNSETTKSATEDARADNNLFEDGNLLSTPFELVYECIETTEAFPPNDQNVATKIDASVVDEALADDIPDKEERVREHEGEHTDTKAITAVCPPPEEVKHVKNDAPEENILKEDMKKLDKFNMQEKSCESKDTQLQIQQQEETQVFLAAEQETTEESVTASTNKNNNTSELFAEVQSQMKTDLKQEAKVRESETIESSKQEDVATPGPEGLSAHQPSVMETVANETTVNLEQSNRIPQNIEKIAEASDTTNEEERSRVVDLSKATEANIPTLLEDQSGSTLEKNNIEEQKPREILEVNGKPKEAECGQYKESISETEPSLSDLRLDPERETSVEKKEPLESKVPLTVQVEKDAKEEEKHSVDEDEQIKDDSGSDAPVMVEASADVGVKPAHKKSHNILSGVGSKVKHSFAKVKKAITGKSSSHKSSSPKQENGSAATA
ncbi:hypothetical protein MKX01_019178 [Papaver californicum]|nr:hypothetical protein MKX01_019178 [Papaver californicum]